MAQSEKKVTYLTNDETDQVSRVLLSWLNQWPDKPVPRINFEFLVADMPGMALSTIQGAFKSKQYILGGYQAKYQFKVIYRIQPGNSNDKRLNGDEVLNRLADWASTSANKPQLSGNAVVLNITSDTRSSLFARYENGDEDHQILMTMTYEVI